MSTQTVVISTTGAFKAGLRPSIGVTCSHSSRPFLCALDMMLTYFELWVATMSIQMVVIAERSEAERGLVIVT